MFYLEVGVKTFASTYHLAETLRCAKALFRDKGAIANDFEKKSMLYIKNILNGVNLQCHL